jgi:hypothetical protein
MPLAIWLYLILKISAYTLAGRVLLRLHEAEGSAFLFGVLRTMMGLAAGWLVGMLENPLEMSLYPRLLVARVVIWAVAIIAFFGVERDAPWKTCLYVVGGVVWSCALDFPTFLITLPATLRMC